ncbi:hypothetical protein Q1695_004226 [Nippostrongylus brasiliensis]|nr:hypothetical protein Q1695_004226 [Nippostrongylus brasiliensis]
MLAITTDLSLSLRSTESASTVGIVLAYPEFTSEDGVEHCCDNGNKPLKLCISAFRRPVSSHSSRNLSNIAI